MAGFEKSGIFPVQREIVIEQIYQKIAKEGSISYPEMLPDDQRWRRAKQGISRIEKRYLEVFSSPTREHFREIALTVNEDQIARDHLEKFAIDRASRLAALNAKKNWGRAVKPSGAVMTSVSVQQIRYAQEIRDQQHSAALKRQSLKAVDGFVKDGMKDLKADYNVWKRLDENRVPAQGGRRGRMKTFKEFIRETDKGDWIPLDQRHPLRLEPELPGWYVDLGEDEAPEIPASMARPLSELIRRPSPIRGLQLGDGVVIPPSSDEDSDDDGDVDIPQPVLQMPDSKRKPPATVITEMLKKFNANGKRRFNTTAVNKQEGGDDGNSGIPGASDPSDASDAGDVVQEVDVGDVVQEVDSEEDPLFE